MKKLKLLLYFLSLILALVLFKNQLCYYLFHYKAITERPEVYSRDSSFTNFILRQCTLKGPKEIKNINEIVELALKITSSNLSFARSPGSVTSSQLIDAKKGNCILFSSYFNLVCTKLFQYYGIDKYYRCTHAVGKIYFGPFSLHHITDDPFWKDHDYNIIRGKRNENYSVDPSLYEYTGVIWVRSDN